MKCESVRLQGSSQQVTDCTLRAAQQAKATNAHTCVWRSEKKTQWKSMRQCVTESLIKPTSAFSAIVAAFLFDLALESSAALCVSHPRCCLRGAFAIFSWKPDVPAGLCVQWASRLNWLRRNVAFFLRFQSAWVSVGKFCRMQALWFARADACSFTCSCAEHGIRFAPQFSSRLSIVCLLSVGWLWTSKPCLIALLCRLVRFVSVCFTLSKQQNWSPLFFLCSHIYLLFLPDYLYTQTAYWSVLFHFQQNFISISFINWSVTFHKPSHLFNSILWQQ